MSSRPLSSIALQSSEREVLLSAVRYAREAWHAESAFAVSRGVSGVFPIEARVGLRDPDWPRLVIRAGRGIGGRVLQELRPRTSRDYLDDPTITSDYAAIVRREALRGVTVVPVADLATPRAGRGPAALVYVCSHRTGTPGDRVVDEMVRIAEMAAVGLAHLRGARAPDAGTATPLTPREQEILRLLAAGCSNRQIADRLVIALPTVKAHLRSVYEKLDVPSRLSAVAAARDRDLL